MKKQNKEITTIEFEGELPKERLSNKEMQEVYWKMRYEELLAFIKKAKKRMHQNEKTK
jgi:hypothetical protein